MERMAGGGAMRNTCGRRGVTYLLSGLAGAVTWLLWGPGELPLPVWRWLLWGLSAVCTGIIVTMILGFVEYWYDKKRLRDGCEGIIP
jgi:hypothetical protein